MHELSLYLSPEASFKLDQPLAEIYICLLADDICVSTTDTSNLGQGVHDLALSIAPLSPMPVGKSIGYRPILIGKPDPGLWVCGAAKWPKWLAILPVFGAICPKFQQPVSGLRRRVA